MRKIIIAVVLIALLVAVGYLKTYRDQTARGIEYDRGKAAATEELNGARVRADSLEQLIVGKDSLYATTAAYRDSIHGAAIDSLKQVAEKQSNVIDSLKSSSKQTPPKSSTKSGAKALALHEKILAYYKDRVGKLPGDLSSYERRIALNEIRAETAQRFEVSLAELEKIRKENKLNY